jgi:MoaA/NifB/PqqE/SkfB family radical SAM enzyme
MNKFLKYYYLGLRKYINRTKPIWILINVTGRCPYGCVYCNLPDEAEMDMPAQVFYRLIDDCVKLGIKFITLTGGESLLRNDIGDLIDYIYRKHNFDLRISTGGVRSEEKLELLKKVDLVNLSFDGPPEVHDLQRFKGSFEIFERNIDFLRKNKIRFRAISVLTNKNMGHVDFILDYAQKHKFDVFFQPLSNTYFFRGNIPEALVLSEEDRRRTARLLLKYKRKYKSLANSRFMLRHLLSENRSHYRCYAQGFFIYAHYNGDIYHCWVNPVDPLGNIKIRPLEEILGKRFAFDPAFCDCTSYSCVEKNYLADYFPYSCWDSRYL